MNKNFNPRDFESEIFNFWIEKKIFDKKNNKKEKYSIILPPPNITGQLHLGHAWDGTIQDTMIRYKKLKGYNTLWISGMDHAGIATQIKFENYLKENNIEKEKYSREEFVNNLEIWANSNSNKIRIQWKKMGFGLDYKNEKFTLSKDNSSYVNKVFIDLYNKKLIYRDYKLVNWDVRLKTAISNIEVIPKEIETKLYFIYYKIENSKKKITIATTRPETMFADTCLVVNSKDKRYKNIIGKFAINPANQNKIKIISDDYVDITYGTGIMKCTPAHDFNDYEIGIKYKQKFTSCMNYDGTMNNLANEFSGLERFKCRDSLIEKFLKNGSLKKIELQKSNVNFSERTNEIIEPLLSLQWFMKMKKIANIVQKNQLTKNKVCFFPKRFEKNLSYWLDNIEDWCISRQLIWGNRIPAWFNEKTNSIYVGNKKISGQDWIQDNDVFDTWFSSGMWPILATNNSLKTNYFQPTNLLVTGYDIIFFWVARMLIFTSNIKNSIPFYDVFIHGLIRDSQGRKMSKSLDNGIDPMDIIEKYGADSLRLFLISSSTIGEDLIYSEEKIIAMSKFLNKLWNIGNFISMKLINNDLKKINKNDLFDLWIMNRFNLLLFEVDKDMMKYNFVVATSKILKFIKNDFSSIYIEFNKYKILENDNSFNFLVLDIFKKMLIIMHPFVPFISEKIYNEIYSNNSILKDTWPNKFEVSQEKFIDNVLEVVEEVRKFKWENQFNKKDIIEINLWLEEKKYRIFLKNKEYLNKIFKLDNIIINSIELRSKNLIIENEFSIIDFCTVEYIFKKNNIINKEKILKEIEKIEFEIKRSKIILSNKSFIKKAPKELINSEKKKLENNKIILNELNFQKNIS